MKFADALDRFPRVLAAMREVVPEATLRDVLAADLPPDAQARMDRMFAVITPAQYDIVSDAGVDLVFQAFHLVHDFCDRLGTDILFSLLAPTVSPGCIAGLTPEQIEAFKHSDSEAIAEMPDPAAGRFLNREEIPTLKARQEDDPEAARLASKAKVDEAVKQLLNGEKTVH